MQIPSEARRKYTREDCRVLEEAGLLELERSKQNLQTWAALETTLTLLPLMPEDAHAAAELRHVLRRKGHQLLTIDAQIAAIALRNGLTLLTTDSDFSMIPALSTESWV